MSWKTLDSIFKSKKRHGLRRILPPVSVKFRRSPKTFSAFCLSPASCLDLRHSVNFFSCSLMARALFNPSNDIQFRHFLIIRSCNEATRGRLTTGVLKNTSTNALICWNESGDYDVSAAIVRCPARRCDWLTLSYSGAIIRMPCASTRLQVTVKTKVIEPRMR